MFGSTLTTILLFAILLIMLVAFLSSLKGSNEPARREYEQRYPQIETYTAEEMELYGVDVRNPDAPNQIFFSRYAKEHGLLPGQQIGKFFSSHGGFEHQLVDPDEGVYNGQVVDEPPQIEGQDRPRLGSGRKLLGRGR